MAGDVDDWRHGGRTLWWRAGMLSAGLALAGCAAVLVIWPHVLAWTVAAALAVLAILCAMSALFARSRRD